MTREFEILEEARKLHQEKYNCEGVCPDFIKGAEWADSHPRKGLVDIEKVCEVLKNYMFKELFFQNRLERAEIINNVVCDVCKAILKEE